MTDYTVTDQHLSNFPINLLLFKEHFWKSLRVIGMDGFQDSKEIQ